MAAQVQGVGIYHGSGTQRDGVVVVIEDTGDDVDVGGVRADQGAATRSGQPS
jgi:hypothetical protein